MELDGSGEAARTHGHLGRRNTLPSIGLADFGPADPGRPARASRANVSFDSAAATDCKSDSPLPVFNLQNATLSRAVGTLRPIRAVFGAQHEEGFSGPAPRAAPETHSRCAPRNEMRPHALSLRRQQRHSPVRLSPAHACSGCSADLESEWRAELEV